MKSWYFNIPTRAGICKVSRCHHSPKQLWLKKKTMPVRIQYLALLSLQGIHSRVNYWGLKISFDNLIPTYCPKDRDSLAINIQTHTYKSVFPSLMEIWLLTPTGVMLLFYLLRKTEIHTFYANDLKSKRASVKPWVFWSIILHLHYGTPIWKRCHMQTDKKSFSYSRDEPKGKTTIIFVLQGSCKLFSKISSPVKCTALQFGLKY